MSAKLPWSAKTLFTSALTIMAEMIMGLSCLGMTPSKSELEKMILRVGVTSTSSSSSQKINLEPLGGAFASRLRRAISRKASNNDVDGSSYRLILFISFSSSLGF